MPTKKEQKIIDDLNRNRLSPSKGIYNGLKYWIIAIVIILLSAWLFCNCSSDTETKYVPVVISDEPEDPPIVIPDEPETDDPGTEPDEPTIITSEPTIALKTADSLKFYDGVYLWTWNTGKIERAKSKNYSCDNVLYKLNDLGYTEESRALVTVPDQITVTNETVYAKSASKEITLQDSNIWIIEDISADEAMNAGALPKPYTKIYRNNVEYGDWMQNQYELEKIVTLENDIYGQIPTTAWYNLNGDKENVRVVAETGLAIYDYNTIYKRCVINGVTVYYTLNFFNGAKQWQQSGDTWYSQNGYSWNGETLVEEGLAMEAYRTAGNMVIPAGTRFENGEYVLYWILCTTGEVIRHVPSVNQQSVYISLYIGDGTTETGLMFINTLKPQIIDDYLYFIFEGDVFRHNFNSNITSSFTTGVDEVWEY